MAAVSVATPFVSHTVEMKWFDFPRTLALMLLPLVTLAAWVWVWRATGRLARGAAGAAHGAPFAGAVSIFVLAFIGLAYSLFPYVVIDRLTFWDAAAHPSSLKVVLAGALIVLPFIIGYTALSYYVFRGKARPGLYD